MLNYVLDEVGGELGKLNLDEGLLSTLADDDDPQAQLTIDELVNQFAF